MQDGRRAVLFSENVDKISSTCPLVVHIIYSYPVKTEVHFIRNSIESSRSSSRPPPARAPTLQPPVAFSVHEPLTFMGHYLASGWWKEGRGTSSKLAMVLLITVLK